MHHTMTRIIRGLVENHPEEWEEMVPYAQFVLRITPLKSLGGRSPYQVVTGIRPVLPRSLTQGQLVATMSVNDYVDNLVGYLRTCHREVRWVQNEQREVQELDTSGHVAYELAVGDLCALAEPQTDEQKRVGPRKFFSRTRPATYRIAEKMGPNTFRLADANSGKVMSVFQHGRNLVKLDLQELPVEPGQKRVIEVFDNTTAAWERYLIMRFSSSGQVCLQHRVRQKERGDEASWVDDGDARWVDLSELHYRWVA